MSETYKLELDRFDIGLIDDMRHGRNIAINLVERSRATYLIAARQFNYFLKVHNFKVNKSSIKAFFDANTKWSPSSLTYIDRRF